MPVKCISIEIPSIKGAGLTTTYKQLFQGESTIDGWDFDIPNCRAMIDNRLEKVFKMFELKEYSHLFTIPYPDICVHYIHQIAVNFPVFTLGTHTLGTSVGIDMVIHQRIFKENFVFFRIYCKRNGKLRKEFFLPLNYPEDIEFVVLCGTDRMLVQQLGPRPLEVVDISCQNPVYIKKTNIYATNKPYYLSRSSKFICNDYSTDRVYVCNLEGDILATLEGHGKFWNGLEYSITYASHITKSEDIIISVCRRDRSDPYTINVSSIVTGKCLANISSDISKCSQIREKALEFPIKGFAYDEKTLKIFTANT